MSGERRLVRIDEAEIPVTLDNDGQIHVQGEPLHVLPAGTGSWLVRTPDGVTRLAYVVGGSDGYWVHVDGAVYTVTIGRASQPRKASTGTTGGELTAPMPSTVLSIVAGPGQPVRTGDPVLILEAMKMELPVRATRDGTVAAVHCREGDLVQPGVTLAEIA